MFIVRKEVIICGGLKQHFMKKSRYVIIEFNEVSYRESDNYMYAMARVIDLMLDNETLDILERI